jgi:hypothetical protein
MSWHVWYRGDGSGFLVWINIQLPAVLDTPEDKYGKISEMKP